VAIWGKAVDHLYILDSGSGVTSILMSKLQAIIERVTFFSRPPTSHWENMNFAIPQIMEDKLLLLDGDTVFSKKSVVQGIYEDLDIHDIVSLTDNSGGIDLFNEFDVFRANKYRGLRRRFAPYLFACKTQLFKQIGSYDFTPLSGVRWTDSMGWISKQLLDLNPTFKELPDDRTSLYYREDGQHQQAAFLDEPSFEWSSTTQNDYGYYHVRNWNGGLYLVETKSLDTLAYQHARSIMPQQEALRLLAWLYIMSSDIYQQEIRVVAQDFRVEEAKFLAYIEQFRDFHSWSRLI